jgi:hypothetical protein
MPDNAEKLNQLIARIERHQQALKLSDQQFVLRYARYLGSAKTWRERLCKRNFTDFGKELPAWERKLENLVAELDGRSPVDLFVSEMPFAQRMVQIYDQLQGQRNDRRCGVLLGTTGTGKSTAGRWLCNEHPRATAYARANENWRDSKTQIAQGLADAIGCPVKDLPGAAARFAKVIEHLKANPLTVIIDESHEGGAMLLKLVKTLIDETSSKFILLAYPTSWNKMLAATDDARSEAQQLFGRTLKPVYTDYAFGIRREDIVIYLRKVAGLDIDASEIANQILPMIRGNGNLRWLADAVEMAQIQADAGNEKLDGALIVEQVKALCPAAKDGGSK